MDLAGGHEAAVWRSEKGGHRCDLRRFGHALEWVHSGEGLLAFLAERFLCEFGRRRSRRQHVDPDAGVVARERVRRSVVGGACPVVKRGEGRLGDVGSPDDVEADSVVERGEGSRLWDVVKG